MNDCISLALYLSPKYYVAHNFLARTSKLGVTFDLARGNKYPGEIYFHNDTLAPL